MVSDRLGRGFLGRRLPYVPSLRESTGVYRGRGTCLGRCSGPKGGNQTGPYPLQVSPKVSKASLRSKRSWGP